LAVAPFAQLGPAKSMGSNNNTLFSIGLFIVVLFFGRFFVRRLLLQREKKKLTKNESDED
jgi:uncharacterized membrane protein YciS (DUF1049 family)